MEILVVVMILGILASIIISSYGNVTRDAQQQAFIHDIKVFNSAAVLFTARTHSYLPSAASGEVPEGFEEYIDWRKWQTGTPIGGAWDAVYMEFGITSGLGVHFNGLGDTRDDEYMTEIDLGFDDGNLASGLFRKIDADRYYIVFAD